MISKESKEMELMQLSSYQSLEDQVESERFAKSKERVRFAKDKDEEFKSAKRTEMEGDQPVEGKMKENDSAGVREEGEGPAEAQMGINDSAEVQDVDGSVKGQMEDDSGGIKEEGEDRVEDLIEENEFKEDKFNITKSSLGSNAAATLQDLSTQTGEMTTPESISHIESLLQYPYHVVTSLVSDIGHEVIAMAQTTQNNSQSMESTGEDEQNIESKSEEEYVPQAIAEADYDIEPSIEEEQVLESIIQDEQIVESIIEDEEVSESMIEDDPVLDSIGEDGQASNCFEKTANLMIPKCLLCNKMFTLHSSLTKHLQLHQNEDKCNLCEKRFFSPAKYASHVKRHHTDPEKLKDVLCSECGKGFCNHAKLKVHMRSHTGERPFPCAFCEKRFLVSSHRKRHEHIHTGEHPHICKTCGKGFGSPSNLKDHTFIHSKDSPYICSTCGKGFTQWGAMMRHISAVHDKRKDVQCPLCSKCFARKDYLKLHIQKVHWKRCSRCKNSFESDEVLKKHETECTGSHSLSLTPSKPIPRISVKRKAGSASSCKRTPVKSHLLTQAKVYKAAAPFVVPPIDQRKMLNPIRINKLLSVHDQFEDEPIDFNSAVFQDGGDLVDDGLQEREGKEEEFGQEQGDTSSRTIRRHNEPL